MGDLAPHFYCDTCSNVFFSESFRALLYEQKASSRLLAQIEESLPDCPCGGHFRSGANPKCPHCHHEIAHKRNAVERLDDPYAIVLEGASLVTDEQGRKTE